MVSWNGIMLGMLMILLILVWMFELNWIALGICSIGMEHLQIESRVYTYIIVFWNDVKECHLDMNSFGLEVFDG